MLKEVVQNVLVWVIDVDVSLVHSDSDIYHNIRFVVIFIVIDFVEMVEIGITVSFLYNFGLVL